MAISDKERREVAERLRMCARSVNGTRDLSMYLAYWVGVMEDEIANAGNPFTVAANRRCAERTLEKLADLIDRPMCKNLAAKSADELLCSECGEHVDIAYMENADDYHAMYCPNCGARVVSGDGD